MVTIKGPAKYALRIGNAFVQFTSNGTLVTDNKDVIEYLSKDARFTVEGKVKIEKKVEKKEVEVKETVEDVVKAEVAEEKDLQALYLEKFGKKVPVNMKNNTKRIEKKLAE